MAATPAAVSASAYDRLHALIVSGRLAPGSPLEERDLCARLGVSRTPVRAALLRLQQDGLVVAPAAPDRGTGARKGAGSGRRSDATREMGRAIVAPLTADDLRDVFLMAGAFEAIAARVVAELPATRRAAVVSRLRTASRGFCAAVTHRPPDLVAAEAHHRRFHGASVAAVAGARRRVEFAALEPLVERYERVYSAAAIYAVEEFTRSHDQIIAAIQAGDGAAAERAVGADWRLAAERHAEMIAMLGERGTW